MGLTSGAKLGAYEIQSSLGAGGMGEVYRATDTKLGRDVALKVLPSEMAQDGERLSRFRREAKTLAQLDHPNIVTIYSVEECDGIHFLTMQLVEGLPLDRVISQSGLPIEQIIEIAEALADALAAAHEKGIVHRDLKPANVMVTSEGRVKVLDFGLAKDIRGSALGDATMTSDSRTQVGVVMGTPAYMSPEQTSGRPLDHRTDIFSLGILLHEMSTGKRPFEGTSSAELVSAILRDTPAPVTDTRPDLPSDLARIIRRCLEKDPRHRIQTARDVSNEFRDLSRTKRRVPSALSSPTRAVATEAANTSSVPTDEGFWVAVLPFKYSGSDADLKALAEGLSEEVITGFSRFSYLRVIARSSTARYANQSVDLRKAAKELGARYVMEGSLRRAGGKVRLSVELVDATTGSHLWAETYERSFAPESVFEVQDDLVPRIVSTVADAHGILPHTLGERVRAKNPDELTPYEAVLRSFSYAERVAPDEHANVRSALERAVETDPTYAYAWAMLSLTIKDEYESGFNPKPNPLERALQAARRAVEIDPSGHRGYHALAMAHFYRRELDAFRTAADRAIAINPMDGCNVGQLGSYIAYAGEWERGCELVEKASRLNPNHPGWFWFPLSLDAFRKGEDRGALTHALKINLPNFLWNHMLLAAIYGELGQREDGARAVQELIRLNPHAAQMVGPALQRVFAPPLSEQLIEGLRKAGLEVPQGGASPATTSSTGAVSGATRADEGFWVAVLPFKYSGSDADLKGLAEGVSEEVITGLSRFSYLRVIARGSTAKYSSESGDVRAIGKELGARYVMEGSLRQHGSKLRLAVQLVEATTGTHLWAETYERALQPESLFELQDELVPRIVSTVADRHGVLPHSMSEAVRAKDLKKLTPYEAVLLSFSYAERITSDEHLAAKACLERTVAQVPGYADAWAMLAMLFCDEYGLGFNVESSVLERALEVARRAVKAGPSNHLAYQNLAYAHFLRREFGPAKSAAERSLALHSLDGSNVWFMGLMLAYMGEWERGCALVERAMQLNPNFPEKYRFPLVSNAYRKGDYRGALNEALRMNLPEVHYTPLLAAAAAGQLGERETAEKALRDLLKLNPDIAASARESLGKWFEAELVEHFIEGLGKAGLEVPSGVASVKHPAAGPAMRTSSGETPAADREGEGFWVAVLPFKYSGSDADLKALAEGVSEEVITGLSRFSYLRVIARGSTAKYSSESGDVRAIGKELGARYVMEGSLRHAGSKLRLTVQLADTASGAHLWAETYERTFTPESLFELQDDLVPRIVATVADQYGVLPRTMSESLRGKRDDELTPHEAVLRTFTYFTRITPDEHAIVRRILERAVREAPDHADCWAMLSMVYRGEFAQGFNPGPNPLDRALAAAQRAVDLAPTHALSHYALATVYFFRKDKVPFRVAAERGLALNPFDAAAKAYLGLLIACAGDWDRGCQMVEAARQLNPNCPGYFYFAQCWGSYRLGKYEEALEGIARANMPNYFHVPAIQAAALAQLGRHEEARKAVQDLLALRPDFAEAARTEYGKWYDDEHVEQVLDGLRKAGLEIPQAAVSPATTSSTTLHARTASGATRTDEGFWVAVLPFKYSGSNADLKALAEGLSEEVITGLSRFSYLHVIARGSTAKYSSESGDARAIGKELGARYVLEGSLRQAGNKMRLAVQLVEAATGSHLWAQTFERTFSPETIFELQDDLVPRIVASVADSHGVLPRTMSQAVRGKNPSELTPYEALLRCLTYVERLNAEEHAIARDCAERAVQLDPNYSQAWAVLSQVYAGEYGHFLNPQPEPLERAMKAARRAVDLDPANAGAHCALAFVLFFRKAFQAFRIAADHAMELNPYAAGESGVLGLCTAYSGDWERGCAIVDRAMQINPRLPGWCRFPAFYNAYRKGNYQEALRIGLKINLPNLASARAAMAAAYGQVGDLSAAQQEVQELYRLMPNTADITERIRRWHLPEVADHLIDGLRKAGLEIPESQ